MPLSEEIARALRVDLPKGNIGKAKWEQFKDDFRWCGELSIDAFIELHVRQDTDRDRSELWVAFGKAALVKRLIECEHPDALFNSPDRGWYGYMYRNLMGGFEDFEKNRVTFITFNYDRSLEEFFSSALADSSGDQAGGFEKLTKIPILHVYGSLCKHPYYCRDTELEACRRYVADATEKSISDCMKYIRIIGDHRGEEAPELLRVQEIIRNARNIVFLGFGYDRTNLARLKLHECSNNPSVRGTSYGLTREETRRVNDYLGASKAKQIEFRNDRVTQNHGWEAEEWHVLEYLRNTRFSM
jgi:hypothetical protein